MEYTNSLRASLMNRFQLQHSEIAASNGLAAYTYPRTKVIYLHLPPIATGSSVIRCFMRKVVMDAFASSTRAVRAGL